MTETNELPTHVECPQCNAKMKSFWVQSRNPGIDVELDRCHSCGGMWFDAGELEVSTGRKVLKSKSTSDRYCPRCLIPLLNAELTAGVAVEACRSCKGVYLDARDMDTVTKHAPVKPPEDVSFICEACGKRKPFALAQTTALGTECSDCFARTGSAPASDAAKERAGIHRQS